MPKLYQMLGTKSRKEQEQRVEALLQMAQEPAFAFTIFVKGGKVRFDVVGDARVTTADMKNACHAVVEELTRIEIENRNKANANEPNPDQPDMVDSVVDTDGSDSVGDIQE